MSWVIVGVAAAGAIMGAEKNKKDREVEDADRKLQGELTRYSWVDGAQQGNPGAIHRAGSMFGDVGQGALSGAMFGQSVKGAMGSGGAAGVENDPSKYQQQSWYEKLQKQDTQKPTYTFGGSGYQG